MTSFPTVYNLFKKSTALGSPWSTTSGYYVNEAEGPKKGPDLPGPLRSHCSLTMDTGESYIVWAIGGLVGEIEDHEHDGVPTDQTLYFDLFNDKTWTLGEYCWNSYT